MFKPAPTFLFAIIAGLACLPGTATSAQTKGTHALVSARAKDAVDRVATVLEVQGVLKSPQENKVEQSKIDVKATVLYDERTLDVSKGATGSLRSMRHYDRAEAKITLPKKEYAPTLRPERRLIGVEVGDDEVTLFSPRGQLNRDELDLVDLLAGSLILDRLLPERPVAINEPWTYSNETMKAVFGLDRIASQTVKANLTTIDAKSAMIEMAGRIEGTVNGVKTRLDIKGKCRFDRKTRRIDWFGLLVKEDRDIGPAAPGFDVVARLQVQILPRNESKSLSNAALAGLPLRSNEALVRLIHEPREGGWRFEHDRRWFPTGGDDRFSYLRLIDQGDFVAQCNVVTLKQVEPGKQATLEQFQRDIKESLGDNFGEFVSASERANDQDYRVIRVVARGEVEKLPIVWHCYLIAEQSGRQVAFTFTTEGTLVERLGEMDQQMIASFRFDRPEVEMTRKSSP
ncbi:MAG: hypothetical protein GX621_03210 [Pirellulaceae bacterium]|nr:hypothetical protein [Pirellulaceae bacterium]